MTRTTILKNLALVLAVGALAGCDALAAPKLTLSADRTTIAAGGFEYAEITATVLKQNEPASGQEVYFETEYGSFSATEEITSISIATDSNGEATVRLYSPIDQGQTQVVATFSDEESGMDAVDRITIEFGPPQEGNMPMQGRFRLECDHINVGALYDPKPDINVPCNLTAQTVGGDVLSVESFDVIYLAEAGTLMTVTGEIDYNVLYSVQGGDPAPVDVEPTGGEPSRAGSLGEEFNPRDGVVSLVAITAGTEAWTDLDSNGRHDSGEPFDDIGEPFLDVDDNGQYDLGEPYHDTDGNGEWTGPNGQFDGQTMIWALTKIVWTGPLAEETDAAHLETEPSSTIISNGGQFTLIMWLLDKHMNPIAAFGEPGDFLEITDSSSNFGFNPDYNVILSEQPGMRFDVESGGIMQFYLNDGCSEQAGCYQVTLYDDSPGTIEDPVIPFTVSVSGEVTPGPNIDDWVNIVYPSFLQTITGTTE